MVRYIKSEIHILVYFSVRGVPEKFITLIEGEHSIGRPDVEAEVRRKCITDLSSHNRRDIDTAESATDGNQQAVLIDIVKSMELPENVIASVVRFGSIDSFLGLWGNASWYSSLVSQIGKAFVISGLLPAASTSCQIR